MTVFADVSPSIRGAAIRSGLRLMAVAGTVATALAGHAWADPAADAPLQLPAVDVQDQAAPPPEGSADSGYRESTGRAGPLGDVPLRDLPYSLNVTSGELFENREAHTMVDALQTNPTVATLFNSNSNISMSRVMIRGFSASDQNELRDGLVDRSFTYVPIENVERIEVLNGFSAFLNGFANPGGSINYVGKMPTSTPTESVKTGFYDGRVGYAQADLAGPVAGTDDRLGYRLIAYDEGGGTYVDGSDQDRTLVSGVSTLRLGEDTLLRVDGWHQAYKSRGLLTYFDAPGGNWTANGLTVPKPGKIDPSTQYGQDWTFNQSEKSVAGLGVDSKLNDTFAFRGAYRYGFMWRQDAYVDATLTGSNAYTEKAYRDPDQTETTHSEYALMDAKAETWGLKHAITFGYQGTDYFYKRATQPSVTLGSSSLTGPAVYNEPAFVLGADNNFQHVYYDNFLAGDRIALTDAWSVLAGLTDARLTQHGWGSAVAISTANYKAEHFSPSLGVMYKPLPAVTTYASYMESLESGDTAPTTAANANQVLAPSVSTQYEVGAKATLGGVDLTAALFRIDKINAELDPADNVYRQDGREIHQGLETTATGTLTERLTVVGGFTLMDAHVANATASPASDGKIPINVPEQEARAYAEYALPEVRDLWVTGGAEYFGRRPVDALNTTFMPSAATFDAGLRFAPKLYGHSATINLNVSNILNTSYWSYYRSGEGLLPGTPRLISLSVKASW